MSFTLLYALPWAGNSDYRIGFDDVFCVFRRREHQATERGITSLTPCAGGVVGRPSTSRSTSVRSVATQLQRCALVSGTPKSHTVKALNVPEHLKLQLSSKFGKAVVKGWYPFWLFFA